MVGDVESSIKVRGNSFEYKIWPRTTCKGELASPAYALSEVGGMCGYSFKEDGKYLIFANLYRNTGYIAASSCGETGFLFARQFHIDILNEIQNSDIDYCTDEEKAKRTHAAGDRSIDTYRQLLEETRNAQEPE